LIITKESFHISKSYSLLMTVNIEYRLKQSMPVKIERCFEEAIRINRIVEKRTIIPVAGHEQRWP